MKDLTSFFRCFLLMIILLTGCRNDIMTIEEARHLYYAVRVENIDFNVPVLYHPLESSLDKVWEAPKPGRETIDAIRIMALLPDMDYYNESTANEFKKLGWGKKIDVMMTHYRVNWPYYFNGAYRRLVKLPENQLVPGMFHFRDPMSDMEDIYLSHDQPIRELTRVRCANPKLDPEPAPSPSCKVTTLYRSQFQLEYTFSLGYLGQWRDIDHKVKSLLDSFISGNSST